MPSTPFAGGEGAVSRKPLGSLEDPQRIVFAGEDDSNPKTILQTG